MWKTSNPEINDIYFGKKKFQLNFVQIIDSIIIIKSFIYQKYFENAFIKQLQISYMKSKQKSHLVITKWLYFGVRKNFKTSDEIAFILLCIALIIAPTNISLFSIRNMIRKLLLIACKQKWIENNFMDFFLPIIRTATFVFLVKNYDVKRGKHV